jgi:hypothetical protein
LRNHGHSGGANGESGGLTTLDERFLEFGKRLKQLLEVEKVLGG